MTIQSTSTRPILRSRPRLFSMAWRAWWLRAAHRKQMRHLDDVLSDPHMARDLGLPPRERSQQRLDLM